jgi:hypothetical protein
VAEVAQDILNSTPMPGANGTFMLDTTNGGLLNPDIPIFEYASGHQRLVAS